MKRSLSLIVALLALACGFFCFAIVPKFAAMYEEMGVQLPRLTRLFLDSSGWLPGGVLLLLAVVLLIMRVRGREGGPAAVVWPLVVVALLVVVMTVLLVAPLGDVIRKAEESADRQDGEKGEGGGGGADIEAEGFGDPN